MFKMLLKRQLKKKLKDETLKFNIIILFKIIYQKLHSIAQAINKY